jgi:hypothetical protein
MSSLDKAHVSSFKVWHKANTYCKNGSVSVGNGEHGGVSCNLVMRKIRPHVSKMHSALILSTNAQCTGATGVVAALLALPTTKKSN